ncbi:MAG: hypothetical protein M1821_005273 [Bathelium mastoideum]|nr:MAG: hypothetical protein M1821_005273 [Bathelium mastoideum]
MALSQPGLLPDSVIDGSNRPSATSMPDTAVDANTDRSIFAARSRRQLGLFLAGAGFCILSGLVTRRALFRRYKATIPPFYQPNSQPRHVNGPAEAAQALGLASLNVFSWAIMGVGGTLWALDISSMDELRRKVRGGLGVDATGKSEQEGEEEMEEWLAAVLSRKHEKEDKKAAAKVQHSENAGAGASR